MRAISFSQSTLKLALNKYCDSLLLTGVDTSITLFDNGYEFFSTDTVKGVGEVSILESAVLIYCNNTKWEAAKLFYGIPINKNNGAVFKSQSIILTDNDSLKQIRFLLPKIQKEELAPFIFAYEQNNETVYYPFGSSSPSLYDIIVRSKDYNITKTINENDILEKPEHFDNMFINLNFKYNKSLSLYFFWQLLNSITKQLDPLFVFEKSNL